MQDPDLLRSRFFSGIRLNGTQKTQKKEKVKS